MSPEQLVQYTTDDRYGSWVHHTDLREMKAFCGLFLARGLLKLNNWDLKRLYREGVGPAVFSATMSRERFKFLNSFMIFNNPETKVERWDYGAVDRVSLPLQESDWLQMFQPQQACQIWHQLQMPQ